MCVRVCVCASVIYERFNQENGMRYDEAKWLKFLSNVYSEDGLNLICGFVYHLWYCKTSLFSFTTVVGWILEAVKYCITDNGYSGIYFENGQRIKNSLFKLKVHQLPKCPNNF